MSIPTAPLILRRRACVSCAAALVRANAQPLSQCNLATKQASVEDVESPSLLVAPAVVAGAHAASTPRPGGFLLLFFYSLAWRARRYPCKNDMHRRAARLVKMQKIEPFLLFRFRSPLRRPSYVARENGRTPRVRHIALRMFLNEDAFNLSDDEGAGGEDTRWPFFTLSLNLLYFFSSSPTGTHTLKPY